MTITSLKVYKGTTYEAELDGSRKIYLHADTVYDFGLSAGKELEKEELRKIIYASNFRRAYQRALYLLDYRDYSAAEMKEKLTENYKNEQLCIKVVKKLEANHIIDDERYAEKLARKYVSLKKFGYRRSLREIMKKGIDKFTAEDSLSVFLESGEFEENLRNLLETKYSRYLADRADKKNIEKAKSALVRSGYGYDEINRAVSEYFDNLED